MICVISGEPPIAAGHAAQLGWLTRARGACILASPVSAGSMVR